MRIKRINKQSLAEYLPIKNAWLHMAACAVTSLGCVAALGAYLYLHSNLAAYFFLVLWLCLFLIFLNMVVNSPDSSNDPTKWLKQFWCRNVRGFMLWCIREPGNPDALVYVVDLTNDYVPAPDVRFALAIPLNGKSCRLVEPGMRCGRRLVRIRLRQLHLSTGTAVLRVQDDQGDRVTVGHETLLEIAEAINDENRLESLGFTSAWGDLVSAMMIRIQCDRRVVADRDAAVAELDEARERIDGTKRFMRSAEAMRIRDWLAQRVIAHAAVRAIPRRESPAA